MKRIIVLILLMPFIPFTLAACGSNRGTEPEGVYTPQAESGNPPSPVVDPTASQTPDNTPEPPSSTEAGTDDEIKAEVFAELESSVTSGIAFNEEGSMLVGVEYGIIKITPDGESTKFCNFRDLPGAVKNYYFSSPRVWDMVVTEDCGVLAAAQDRILKISRTGEISTLATEAFKGFLGATGIETDREGNLYVTDGSRIIRYNSAMETEDFVEAENIGISSFFSLKFDPGFKYLYATDFNTSSLLRIPINDDGSAGTPEMLVEEPIKGARPYGAPLNIIFSEAGTLYTSLDCKRMLLRMDSEDKTEMIAMPKSGMNHYIAFGGKGFDEESVYFTTNGDAKIYRFPVGEKAATVQP